MPIGVEFIEGEVDALHCRGVLLHCAGAKGPLTHTELVDFHGVWIWRMWSVKHSNDGGCMYLYGFPDNTPMEEMERIAEGLRQAVIAVEGDR